MKTENSRLHFVRQQDRWFSYGIRIGGVAMVIVTAAIAIFLAWKGSATFTVFHHSVWEFLTSTKFAPKDTMEGGGQVGAWIFIYGSILTCAVALCIATPLCVGTALWMTTIKPKWGDRYMQPVVEVFMGIPSVVYGWLGLTILVPAIKTIFNLQTGFSVLAASLVLTVMIFPTITSVVADAFRAVPSGYTRAAYGLGATRWQVIYKIMIPAAKNGILTGIVLGLARAFGEALAVAMVIGKTKAIPHSLLDPTINLTAEIAADMGGAMEGGEYNMALWSMAFLLFIISAVLIALIHYVSHRKGACE